MDGLRPVRAENLAGFQRLAQLNVRPTPRQEATSGELGPAAELERGADPFSSDPTTYKDYTLVHVLLLGEKVSELRERRRSPAGAPAAESPHVAPPGRGAPRQAAPRQAAGEQVTVSIQEQHLDIEVRQGDTLISVNVDVQTIQIRREPVQKSDPLVLDLDGDGIEVSTLDDGVRFDLNGDGVTEQMASVQGGDGFLALDRDGDGAITSGRELFGDQHGAANGFDELARFDGNRDGVINRQDAVFDALHVWRDADSNGASTAGELATLAELGIESIQLDYQHVSRDVNGNEIAQSATYRTTDGHEREAADVLLAYQAS